MTSTSDKVLLLGGGLLVGAGVAALVAYMNIEKDKLEALKAELKIARLAPAGRHERMSHDSEAGTGTTGRRTRAERISREDSYLGTSGSRQDLKHMSPRVSRCHVYLFVQDDIHQHLIL